ncbi:MAG: phage holin family protein, partial [Bacilli bacterium]|nr:phage holin family protein [Bacilli bacterium]
AALRTAVCLFYIGNEGISIVENAEKLGVPIPKFLHGKFLSFTEENQKEEKLLSGKKNVKPKVRETSN